MVYIITQSLLSAFHQHLRDSERASATIEKYLRDVTAFSLYIGDSAITKESLIDYKQHLQDSYAPASVNSMLSALNHFFTWCGWELHVRALKIQHKLFRDEEKELSKEEYLRLLDAAWNKSERLWLLIQTIGSTGIRVSELQYITVEAAKKGRTDIQCKGKTRTILLPLDLRKELIRYAKLHGIKNGPIFLTKTGRVMNRSNIWRALKSLCEAAGVLASKVFPHNLRHLFATTFYEAAKDIARLADVLGHSSINTTRIYIATSGQFHSQIIEGLGLIQTSNRRLTTT
jgi:site-specific recombinase XerD